MRYRVIISSVDESFDIITENGGVAYFHYADNNFVTKYFERSLRDCTNSNYVWDELSEGKAYTKDWEGAPTFNEVVKDALGWLVFPEPETWEHDENLWTEFFPKK